MMTIFKAWAQSLGMTWCIWDCENRPLRTCGAMRIRGMARGQREPQSRVKQLRIRRLCHYPLRVGPVFWVILFGGTAALAARRAHQTRRIMALEMQAGLNNYTPLEGARDNQRQRPLLCVCLYSNSKHRHPPLR